MSSQDLNLGNLEGHIFITPIVLTHLCLEDLMLFKTITLPPSRL